MANDDAADKEMAAEVARRTDELKSAVFDALAHEIKSPLAAMNVAVTTLLSNHPGNAAQQKELLDAIQREVSRLNRRIDEVMRTAQIEAGQPVLERRPWNVCEIVSASLTEMELPLQDRPVQTEISDALPLVDCDEVMIKRVLKILLDNAAKYSPAGSPIRVHAGSSSDGVMISVTNAGPALEPVERERVFEKYYRGPQAQASATSGTGLGLWSARCIIEAHGGRIWATGEQGWNAFHFSLPVAESFGCLPHTS